MRLNIISLQIISSRSQHLRMPPKPEPADFLVRQPKSNRGGVDDQAMEPEYHQSSRQAEAMSDRTEKIDQQPIEQRPVETCLQMIMIGPCDTTYYDSMVKRLKVLEQKYNKDEVIGFIRDNAKYSNVDNLHNLEAIDDDDFWVQAVPILLQNLADRRKQKSISACIRMLAPHSNELVELSKAQILMILTNMFFCTLPRQTHHKNLNFAQLMQAEPPGSESRNSAKLQKLKCIINYLKVMSKRNYSAMQRKEEKIRLQRPYRKVDQKQYREIEFNLVDIEIIEGRIEDYKNYGIMTDFANKKIGGGVLTRGAVQEEILFVVFPELIAALCICYQLREDEALVVSNAERFNNYCGYSDTFSYEGPFLEQKQKVGPFKSMILAVDAEDFRGKQKYQYQAYYLDREMRKFILAVEATDGDSEEGMPLYTGRWGCGAFCGDFYLKFLIQWVACSVQNKSIVFVLQNKEEIREFEIFSNFLKRFSTQQVLDLVTEYDDYLAVSQKPKMPFIDFFKKFIC